MLKAKISQKKARDSFHKLIRIGYCKAQYLLRNHEPAYYSSGIYGWNCDYYLLPRNIVICTGYRPTGQKVDYDLVHAFERKAQEIVRDYTFHQDYEEYSRKMRENLNIFLYMVDKTYFSNKED